MDEIDNIIAISNRIWKRKDAWRFSDLFLLHETPSRVDGLSFEAETQHCQRLCQLIQTTGQLVEVSQLCINTACVYLRRFFTQRSMVLLNRDKPLLQIVSVICLFLAAKVEEKPRKLEHVIVQKVRICGSHTARPIERESVEVAASLDLYKAYEEELLKVLGFDLTVDHPHTHVVKACQLFNASADFAQTAYFMATNALHLTNLCLQHSSATIAGACIWIAFKWSRLTMFPSRDGSPWYHFVDKSLTTEKLETIGVFLMNTFEKHPLTIHRIINPQKYKEDMKRQRFRLEGVLVYDKHLEEKELLHSRIGTPQIPRPLTSTSSRSSSERLTSPRTGSQRAVSATQSSSRLEGVHRQDPGRAQGHREASASATRGQHHQEGVLASSSSSVVAPTGVPSATSSSTSVSAPAGRVQHAAGVKRPSGPGLFQGVNPPSTKKLSLQDYQQRAEHRPVPSVPQPSSSSSSATFFKAEPSSSASTSYPHPGRVKSSAGPIASQHGKAHHNHPYHHAHHNNPHHTSSSSSRHNNQQAPPPPPPHPQGKKQQQQHAPPPSSSSSQQPHREGHTLHHQVPPHHNQQHRGQQQASKSSVSKQQQQEGLPTPPPPSSSSSSLHQAHLLEEKIEVDQELPVLASQFRPTGKMPSHLLPSFSSSSLPMKKDSGSNGNGHGLPMNPNLGGLSSSSSSSRSNTQLMKETKMVVQDLKDSSSLPIKKDSGSDGNVHGLPMMPNLGGSSSSSSSSRSNAQLMKEAKVVVQDLKDSQGQEKALYANAEASRRRSLSQSYGSEHDAIEEDYMVSRDALMNAKHESQLKYAREEEERESGRSHHHREASQTTRKSGSKHKSPRMAAAAAMAGSPAPAATPLKIVFKREQGGQVHIQSHDTHTPSPTPSSAVPSQPSTPSSSSSALKMKVRVTPNKTHVVESGATDSDGLKVRLQVGAGGSGSSSRGQRSLAAPYERRHKGRGSSGSSASASQLAHLTSGSGDSMSRAGNGHRQKATNAAANHHPHHHQQQQQQQQASTYNDFTFNSSYFPSHLPENIFEPEATASSSGPGDANGEMSQLNAQLLYGQSMYGMSRHHNPYGHQAMLNNSLTGHQPPLPPPLPDNPPPPPPPPPQ